ncbi:flagellar hook protein [Thioclava sp. BHET1]|nr:flagellar hook protein [Thioclava sp. BHET1]
MSTSSVSSLFSSGEIKSIVGQLQKRIQAPITLEANQIKSDNTQISALGAVQGALSSLNGALSGISDPASLATMSAETSASSIATASASASAASGTYSLSNVQLARTQEIYSGSFASGDATLGSGAGALTFQFGSGGSAQISVPSSADTVSGIADAVNAADKGVSASVVTTATGVRLVFQSDETGSAKSFTVAGSGAAAGLSYSGSGSGTMTLGQSARNASFTLNGVPVTETSNSGISLVKGLTVSLVASGSASISTSSSTAGLSSALSSFTNKLNNAVGVIAKQTAYQAPSSSASASASGSSAKKIGPLLGDVQIQQLKQDLLSTISSAAGSGLSANSLGFSISSSGKLSFDSATFDTAYAGNEAAADSLIQSIETSVGNIVTGAIGSAGATAAAGSGSGTAASGFVGAAQTDLKATVSSLKNQIASQSKIGNEQIANLESQFSDAISATSGTSTTLSYLSVLMGSSGSS